jgi:hypothetical protein
MASKTTQDALRGALDQLSQPFKTTEEVRVVSMKLDAIVAILLRSDYVQQDLGKRRVRELALASPALPNLLREVGKGTFTEVAEYASNLLGISQSSTVDIGEESEAELIGGANVAREKFHAAFTSLLGTLAL